MNHSTVKEKKRISSADVIENIKIEIIENENTYEPGLIMKSDVDIIKQTWDNRYDTSFNMCKEEPYDNPFKSGILSEEIVDTLHPETDLSSNQQYAEPCYNEKPSECVTLESSNCYLGHSEVDVKLEYSLQPEFKSADCIQALGSSGDISMKINNFQRNKTTLELGEINIVSNYQNTPCTSKDTYVYDINTNINNDDGNFEIKTDLENQWYSQEAQTVSALKRNFFYRDLFYEDIQTVNVSTKNEMSADINEPVKKQTKAISYNEVTDDSRPVSINNSDKWNSSLEEKFIDNKTSSRNNRKSCSKLQNVKFKNNVNVHMKRVTAKKPYLCHICNSKFACKVTLGRHIRTHSGEKPYACDLCSYKCNFQGYLTIHMKTHSDDKPFSCDICNYKCNQKSYLVGHMRTHTGYEPFSCDICHSKFSRKDTLLRHTRTHTGEKPFSCELCNYKCKQKGNLTTHMKIHTGEKPFTCHICNYKCYYQSYLTIHMNIHTVEKPFTCNICNFKCSRKRYLSIHMKTHIREKPFSCDLCKYKCNQKGYLVNHMRTHTGLKPYSCNICKYKCHRKGILANHMRTHNGEMPFLCNVCKFQCSQKGDFMKHMRTHTGWKPFSCTICKYQSDYKGNLRKHMRTHSKGTPILL